MDERRIILLNPLVGDDYEFARENRPLPLGLLAISSLLVPRFPVVILDQRMDPDFERRLAAELDRDPLLVGVHVMGGPQIGRGLALARRIKQRRAVPLVWGGAFPTMVPDAVLGDPAVDFVVRGEGEIPMRRLAEALADGGDLATVPSLSYRRDGAATHNERAPLLNLDELPDPPLPLVDVRRYDWSAGVNQPIAGLKLQMETSRGCRSSCVFCYNPFFHQKTWRALSAERSAAQFERLVRDFGAGHIDLIDDSFFEDLARVRDFARAVYERQLGVSYLINGGKVEPLLAAPEEDLILLRRSGCHTIHIGAESGSDRVLQRIAKGVTAAQIRASNLRLRRVGLRPSYYFVYGAPGEADDDVRQSVDAMLGILRDNPQAKIVAAFSFTPFAQTPSYRLAVAQGMPEPRTLDEWSRFDTLNTLQPWLNERQKRRLRVMFFLTMFIDRKIQDLSPSPLVRGLAALYRPFAKLRLRRGWFRLALEERFGRAALAAIQRRGARRFRSTRDEP